MKAPIPFYKMARGWLEHPMFRREPLCQRAAWVWLIENALFSPRSVRLGGKTVALKRGQLCYSIRFLAHAWGWKPARVQRFIKRLNEWNATDTAKDTATDTGRLLITIREYNKYQSSPGMPDTDADTPTERQPIQIRKNDNSSTYVEGAPAPIHRVDPAKPIFETGKALLAQYGFPESKAGGLVQRWRRELGNDPALLNILQEAGTAQRHDITAYVSGCVRNRKRGERGPAAPAFGTPEYEEHARKWGAA